MVNMDKYNLILCFIHRFMHILGEVGDFESTAAFCNEASSIHSIAKLQKF